MTILLILLGFLVGLFALFLGGSLVAQPFLYNTPSERLPLRSAIAAAGLTLFLGLWFLIDRSAPGKYDTLLNFSSTEVKTYDRVESVRRHPRSGKEETVAYKRQGTGGRSQEYLEERKKETPRFWQKADPDGVAIAVLIQEEGREGPTRFLAPLDAKGNFPRDASGNEPSQGMRYVEENGRGYIDAVQVGTVTRPRRTTAFFNLLLNFAHLAAWVLALWLGLRYQFWHSVGGAFFFWLALTLVLLPLIFDATRPSGNAPKAEPPKAARLPIGGLGAV